MVNYRKHVYKKILMILMLTLLFFCGHQTQSDAAGDKSIEETTGHITDTDGKTVIIVLNEISLNELNTYRGDNIDRLLEEGAAGLLNCNTGDVKNSDNCCAVIGAGARITATGFGADYYDSDELYSDETVSSESITASDEYFRRTGRQLTADEGACLSAVKLQTDISSENYKNSLGLLGDTLHEAGLKTAVIGNADYKDIRNRQIGAVLCTSDGTVDYSYTSGMLTADVQFPAGMRTDYQAMRTAFTQAREQSDVIAVELGDFTRINTVQDYYTSSMLESVRLNAWRQADEFIGYLIENIDLSNDLLLFVVPDPGLIQQNNNDLLTPFIAAGPGLENGIASSFTTKRSGVVCNIDIGSEILEFYGLDIPPAMIGKTIFSDTNKATAEDKLAFLTDLNDHLVFVYSHRNAFIKTYVTVQIILLLLSLLFVFWKRLADKSRYLMPLLVANMCFPLALLLVAFFPVDNVWLYGFIVLSIVAILTVLCSIIARRREVAAFTIISALTALLLLLDIFTGQNLIKNSFLGYDPVVGARFYGIGNEYMGVLIGAVLIASAALINDHHNGKLPFIMACIVYLLTLFAIAAPNLGTNVGGSIAAVVGFLSIMLLFANYKLNFKNLLIIGAAVFTVLAVMMIFDSMRDASQQSHIGRTVSAITSGGLAEVWDIISRKMATNIKLIHYSIWSKLFVASLLTLALLFYAPVGLLKKIRSNYTYLYYGFYALIAASVAALLFNDSGVVAAATMMIFGASPLIWLIMRERSRNKLIISDSASSDTLNDSDAHKKSDK